MPSHNSQAAVIEYPPDLSATEKAQIELAIDDAEHTFRARPEPVITADGTGGYLESYSRHEAAIQVVLTELETSWPVYRDAAGRHAWPVDRFRGWFEWLRDQLIERAYQCYRVRFGPRVMTLETFTVLTQRVIQASDCWSQYHTVLQTLSTAQTVSMPLKTQLKTLLREAEWTPDQLAEHAGFDRTSVQRHLSGKVTRIRSANKQQYETTFSQKLQRPIKLDV